MHPQTKSGRITRAAAAIAFAMFGFFLLIALTGVINLDARDRLIGDLATKVPLTMMFLAGNVAAVSGIWSLARDGERATIVYVGTAIGVMFSFLLLLELFVIE
jgi:hypothetical protein